MPSISPATALTVTKWFVALSGVILSILPSGELSILPTIPHSWGTGNLFLPPQAPGCRSSCLPGGWADDDLIGCLQPPINPICLGRIQDTWPCTGLSFCSWGKLPSVSSSQIDAGKSWERWQGGWMVCVGSGNVPGAATSIHLGQCPHIKWPGVNQNKGQHLFI